MIAQNKKVVDRPRMVFGEGIQAIQHSHSNLVALTLKVGIMNVRRVLVDTGSTADLIVMDCMKH